MISSLQRLHDHSAILKDKAKMSEYFDDHFERIHVPKLSPNPLAVQRKDGFLGQISLSPLFRSFCLDERLP